jgi:hypothetical protein
MPRHATVPRLPVAVASRFIPSNTPVAPYRHPYLCSFCACGSFVWVKALRHAEPPSAVPCRVRIGLRNQKCGRGPVNGRRALEEGITLPCLCGEWPLEAGPEASYTAHCNVLNLMHSHIAVRSLLKDVEVHKLLEIEASTFGRHSAHRWR